MKITEKAILGIITGNLYAMPSESLKWVIFQANTRLMRLSAGLVNNEVTMAINTIIAKTCGESMPRS